MTTLRMKWNKSDFTFRQLGWIYRHFYTYDQNVVLRLTWQQWRGLVDTSPIHPGAFQQRLPGKPRLLGIDLEVPLR